MQPSGHYDLSDVACYRFYSYFFDRVPFPKYQNAKIDYIIMFTTSTHPSTAYNPPPLHELEVMVINFVVSDS